MLLASESKLKNTGNATETARKPRYRQIIDVLHRQIVNGQYSDDQKLPSENQLMSMFGVSRVTIRNALRSLCDEGLLESMHGKGYFVIQPKIVLDLERLSGLGTTATLQGHEVTSKVVGTIERPASKIVSKMLNLDRAELIFELSRIHSLNGKPFLFQLSCFPLALGKRLYRENLESTDLMAILENDLHIKFCEAEVDIEVSSANQDLSKRLFVPEGTSMVLLTRTVKTAEGLPFIFERLYGRSDVCRFTARSLNKLRTSRA